MHADSMEDMEKAAQAQGISFEDFKQNLEEQHHHAAGDQPGGWRAHRGFESGNPAILQSAQD